MIYFGREVLSIDGYLGAEASDIWEFEKSRAADMDPKSSTPQLPFKTPQIPSNRDHKALNRGTLGGLGC